MPACEEDNKKWWYSVALSESKNFSVFFSPLTHTLFPVLFSVNGEGEALCGRVVIVNVHLVARDVGWTVTGVV